MQSQIERISIAIDGFSSCGKSTLAKALAHKLNYNYLDTGAMYRAVTLYAMDKKMYTDGTLNKSQLIHSLPDIFLHFEVSPLSGKSEIYLNNVNVESRIRSLEVARFVSEVSTIPEVRRKLQSMQREIGRTKGVVMDGRDIGTVVMPDAELKIFMTAENDIRAARRYAELKSQGKTISMNEVYENLRQRDYIDSNRVEDPLRKADDALVLDNSNLSEEQQLQLAYSWAIDKINQGSLTGTS
jgi:cytidylate kinase